jgi:hypothetical protein
VNDRHQENQSVTPTPLVRDEGVGGSNPLTPTITKLKKLFAPAQPTAQATLPAARWSYERGSISESKLRGYDNEGNAIWVDWELNGYLIHNSKRGGNYPVGIVFDVMDADRIVSCLNAMEARQ